mgnify:FL=1
MVEALSMDGVSDALSLGEVPVVEALSMDGVPDVLTLEDSCSERGTDVSAAVEGLKLEVVFSVTTLLVDTVVS